MNYRHASDLRDLSKMMIASAELGSSSWQVSNTIQAAIQSNYPEQAKSLADRFIQQYPRDFYGWKVRYALTTSTPDQRNEALNEMHKLDPFNPDLPKS